MLTDEQSVAQTGLDAAAIKPTESDVARALELPFDIVAIDYEGREHLPDAGTLRYLAHEKEVRLTVPVRANGFDPLGDDHCYDWLPTGVKQVLVAGHSAYLTEAERSRAVSSRLRAARDRFPDAWVGTEGIERVALAAGGTQYELLSRRTERDLRALRAAGFDGGIAVYAPTVLSDDTDVTLDALGQYVARRGPVARALPADPAADSAATGRTREILEQAVRDYALVGDVETVSGRIQELKAAGADLVVGYPAGGIAAFLD
jgi:hypothetical protein